MATWYRVRNVNEVVCATDTVEVEPNNGTDFTHEELQGYIGGYIEVVYLNNDRMMIVYEEGKLKGLPFNVAATLAYNEGTGRYDDLILGNAIVCNRNQVK